jgi:hypothetical protein
MSNAAIASRLDAILSPTEHRRTHRISLEPNREKEKKVKIAFKGMATLATLAYLWPCESHVCRKCHRDIARTPVLLIPRLFDFQALTPRRS